MVKEMASGDCRWEGGIVCKGHKGIEMCVLMLVMVDNHTRLSNSSSNTLKMMNFILCKLYFNKDN